MLEPSTVPVNSPTFTITVVGKNFGSDVLLYWNNTAVHTIPINSQQLMGEITTTDLQTVGEVPVFVRTGGQNSNTVDFEVTTQ
ncbi:MAG TPA: IPT/TIG domain-containing protein [Terriglobales bacterium]|nr:IPT/TIG domain-containing protein [Terriglobales bacterium]